MRKLFMLLLLLLVLNSVRADNSITITFFAPQTNQPYDSSLYVSVDVQSTFQISTVIADVQGHQANLIWDAGSQSYAGNVSLSGLPKGISLLLTVTVTDVFNTQQSASQNFVYVPPPVININAPINNSSAYPALQIKANGISIDTCTVKVEVIFSQTLFVKNFTTTVDTTISIQPSIAYTGYVRYTVTDRWGQQVTNSKNIFFDSSIYLAEAFSSPENICDFNYGRVLIVPYNQFGDLQGIGKMFDLNTQAFTTLTGFYITNVSRAYVTPNGAFNAEQNVLDWNNGALSYSNPGASLGQTAGMYETYLESYTDLYLRDINTQTNILIATDTMGQFHENHNVGPDGTVIYGGYDNNYFFRYKNGVHSVVTPPSHGRCNFTPQADSGYVLYMTEDNLSYDYYIYLNDGGSNIELSHMGDLSALGIPLPGQWEYYKYYRINGKSVAYVMFGTANEYQIWLRDSTGVISQRTFFSTSSLIDGINSRGDIMYINGGRRYLAKAGTIQPPVDYGAALGRAVYRDSSWYVINGVHLYRLLVDAYQSVGNGNWDDPATWAGGIVPPPGANVIILNNVIVNVNVTCNILNVHSPGSVTVLPGITLTVLH